MNPIYLNLVNFRSHPDTRVDLSNFDIAVIIGKNGDGKSSIIYGMIYALWGEVPDINLPDLVRKGARDMSVSMGFIHDDGNTYKIERGIKVTGTKKKTSTGYLKLHLEAADGSFKDISENSIDETTKKISTLMGGLTYKTALYSNFNLQGESDKFMQARPAERRKLFEDILNLKPYETLEKAARAKAKEARDILKSLDYDDTKEENVEAEIKTLEATLQDLKNRTSIAQAGVESFIKSIKQLEVLISGGTTDLEAKLHGLYAEVTRLRNQAEACRKQINECDVIIQQKAEIITKYELLKTTSKLFDESIVAKQKYTTILGTKNVLATKVTLLTEEIKKRQQELKTAENKLQATQSDICSKYAIANKEDILGQLQRVGVSNTTEQAQVQLSINSTKEQQKEAQEAIDAIQAIITTLIAEIKAIDSQVDRIEKSSGSLCPVFNSECARLRGDNTAKEIESLKIERQKKVETGTQKKADKIKLEQENKQRSDIVSGLEKREKELIRNLNLIETTIKNYTNSLQEMENSRKNIEHVIVKNTEDVTKIQENIGTIDADIATLGFNSDSHDQIEKLLSELRQQQWEDRYQKMLVAEETTKGTKEKLSDLDNRIGLVGAEIIHVSEEIDKRRDEINKIQPEITKQRTALVATKAELEKLGKETSIASQHLGTAQATLDQLCTRKNAAATYQQQLVNYENLIRVYQLARAMILESSTPRFQQFCNDCLDFLGVNIRVRIETIEETVDKDKTTKYNTVFKIIVIDGEGDERDYATWSGGEKHRINIALRQALAMTLLNRSGVKIGLVVIDEGDSKLDENGKDALVQMIEATSHGKFGYAAKVLFVTHAEDLKDRFSTRILVSKGQSGSNVVIQ